MSARILDGKRIAAEVTAEVADDIERFVRATGVRPTLVALLVGDDPASEVYVRNKRRACERAGLKSALDRLSAQIGQAALVERIGALNADAGVHGILLQLPLPAGLDADAALAAIEPRKDVDGLHPANLGLLAAGRPRFLPCTPAGVQQILIREKICIAGAHVVIIGRSNLVGKPLALMFLQKGPGADATVTVCHSRSQDLAELVRAGDIVIAAAGRPELVTADMIKPGAAVIDVGIHRTAGGNLVGDVAFRSVAERAGALTPVPGGVGPMTISMLLANTLKAAKLQSPG